MTSIELSKEQKSIADTQLMNQEDPLFNYGLVMKYSRQYVKIPIDKIGINLVEALPILSAVFKNDELFITNHLEVQLMNKIPHKCSLTNYVNNDLTRSFNIHKDPLCSVIVFIGSRTLYLYFKIHHLIFDGASVPTLEKVTSDILAGRGFQVQKAKSLCYLKFHGKEINNSDYWIKKMDAAMGGNTFDTVLKETRSNRATTISGSVNEGVSRTLQKENKEQHISLSQYALSCLGILNQFYDNKFMNVGLPLNYRREEASGLVGCYINVLPFISNLKFLNYEDYVHKIGTELVSLYRHANYSISSIKKITAISGLPYNVTLSVLDSSLLKIPNNVSIYEPLSQQEDLSILIFESEQGKINVKFTYKENAFNDLTIRGMLSKYIYLFSTAFKTPNCQIKCNVLKG